MNSTSITSTLRFVGKMVLGKILANREMPQSLSSEYWDQVAKSLGGKYYFDSRTGGFKSDCFVSVVERWLGPLRGGVVLKTDLWEEAFGSDQVLFREEFGSTFNVGIDVSPGVALKAKSMSGEGRHLCFSACNVCQLPLKDQSVDIIISTSTLDHFDSDQTFAQSLDELGRILKPGGSLILFLDNKWYIFRWLMKLKWRMGATQIFIGKTYSVNEVKGFLPGAGLTTAHATAITHVPVLVFTQLFRLVSAVLGGKTSKVLRFLDMIGRLPLGYFTGTYIAVHAVKK
jgi:SAM-dependent methyltransferase